MSRKQNILSNLKKDLLEKANPKKAALLQRFFKTGPGEYGEGDIFLGIMVPETRKLAKKYGSLPLSYVQKIINSKIHEERLLGFLILVNNFEKGDEKIRKEIFNFYIKNAKKANNWDLVDLSAHKISGAYLLKRNKSILYRLARSKNLWEKRISVISTFQFIKYNSFEDSLKIAEILLKDKHDLIHKAVGWMLREIGKRNLKVEERFLKKHLKEMPRTALRYAIEKFPKSKRIGYLEN